MTESPTAVTRPATNPGPGAGTAALVVVVVADGGVLGGAGGWVDVVVGGAGSVEVVDGAWLVDEAPGSLERAVDVEGAELPEAPPHPATSSVMAVSALPARTHRGRRPGILLADGGYTGRVVSVVMGAIWSGWPPPPGA
jgi:hypothetical protein